MLNKVYFYILVFIKKKFLFESKPEPYLYSYRDPVEIESMDNSKIGIKKGENLIKMRGRNTYMES